MVISKLLTIPDIFIKTNPSKYIVVLDSLDNILLLPTEICVSLLLVIVTEHSCSILNTKYVCLD